MTPRSAANAGLQEGQNIGSWNRLRLGLAAALVFQVAVSQTAIADNDAVRNADEFHVGKLDTGAGLLVAVVQQHFKASGGQLGVELVGSLAYHFGFIAQRYQRNLEWRQGVVPRSEEHTSEL